MLSLQSRQLLHADVAEQPAAQDDASLEQDIALHLPSAEGGAESQRQEDEGAEERVEKQHGHDGIVAKGMLLRNVIEAQQQGTQQRKG